MMGTCARQSAMWRGGMDAWRVVHRDWEPYCVHLGGSRCEGNTKRLPPGDGEETRWAWRRRRKPLGLRPMRELEPLLRVWEELGRCWEAVWQLPGVEAAWQLLGVAMEAAKKLPHQVARVVSVHHVKLGQQQQVDGT